MIFCGNSRIPRRFFGRFFALKGSNNSSLGILEFLVIICRNSRIPRRFFLGILDLF